MAGDGVLDIQPTTVAMVQTASLCDNPGYEKLRECLQNAKWVIGDEIHHLESDQWYSTLARMQAPWRIGLTATPHLVGPGLALIGMMGEIIAQIDILDLIERKVLVIPKIWFLDIRKPRLPKKMPWQEAYSKGIINNAERNTKLCEVAGIFKAEGKPAITLVRRINHGNMLTDLYNHKGIRSDFIYGEVTQKQREDILNRLKEGSLDHIVANVDAGMGEGVDIPWLRAVINATGMSGGGNKAEGDSGRQTIQLLGRTIRAYPGKKYADYVDVCDLTQRSLTKATLDRVKTLESEGYTPFIQYWRDYVPDL
jgi:superfamily II DNA or RNA helicase